MPAVRDGLIVLEGMPGAGKTTAARALRGRGWPVLGEYTDDADAAIAISHHGSHPPTLASQPGADRTIRRKGAFIQAA